jgi:carboxyl-terminal processing protease
MKNPTRAAPAARSRRAFVQAGVTAAVVAALPRAGAAAEPAHDVTADQDFDELWETLRDRYCFFDDKRTDWNRVRTLYRPQAIAAQTIDDFQAVIGRALDELYDAHTHLANPPDGSHRWPLYDLLAERAGNDVRIVAVEGDSSAADAGVRIGDSVIAVNGAAIENIIDAVRPRCLAAPDARAEAWAINVAVAGKRAQPREITVCTKGAVPRTLALPLKQRPASANVESRRLAHGLGYIAIRTFAETSVVDGFESALADLRDTRGLILDVRHNGGGDTAVARPIMGRFITETTAYATMRRREGAGLSAAWSESVDPRGPFTYINPVVVLADHWSASMAEGFPMGMRGIGRATLVGTPMMGLGAAVYSIRLDRTGVQAQYSGEPVYDVQGNPRWELLPDVSVPSGKDVLVAGIAALEARIRRS